MIFIGPVSGFSDNGVSLVDHSLKPRFIFLKSTYPSSASWLLAYRDLLPDLQ